MAPFLPPSGRVMLLLATRCFINGSGRLVVNLLQALANLLAFHFFCCAIYGTVSQHHLLPSTQMLPHTLLVTHPNRHIYDASVVLAGLQCSIPVILLRTRLSFFGVIISFPLDLLSLTINLSLLEWISRHIDRRELLFLKITLPFRTRFTPATVPFMKNIHELLGSMLK